MPGSFTCVTSAGHKRLNSPVLGKLAEIAIGLIVPVGETPFDRQKFRLIDESAAQTASIDFLQADDIEAANQRGDAAEIVEALGAGQEMFPAVREVVAVTVRGDPGLDVVAEQLQPPCGGNVCAGYFLAVAGTLGGRTA